jgi:hypothetical protein
MRHVKLVQAQMQGVKSYCLQGNQTLAETDTGYQAVLLLHVLWGFLVISFVSLSCRSRLAS